MSSSEKKGKEEKMMGIVFFVCSVFVVVIGVMVICVSEPYENSEVHARVNKEGY